MECVKAFAILAVACVTGLLLMFAWVALWTDVVPLIFFGWTWTGHEALLGPVFFTGVIGGLLGLAFIRR